MRYCNVSPASAIAIGMIT